MKNKENMYFEMRSTRNTASLRSSPEFIYGDSFCLLPSYFCLLNTGWLAIDTQDAESLGWCVIDLDLTMQTARGEQFFDLYEGRVLLDGQEFIVPVHAGAGIPEVLLGLQWLETRRLFVDRPQFVLTLG